MPGTALACLRACLVAGLTAIGHGLLGAQQGPAPAPPRSAPLSDIRYEVTFDSATAGERTIKVAMSFTVGGPGPVLLSLPAWTPGSYEINNYARWISHFAATSGGKDLAWDKLDYDTWRVRPAGARAVRVSFDYAADTLDNAMAWSRPDFAFFNGTNLFFYPEGRGFGFPAAVMVTTQSGWTIATGMKPAAGANTYSAASYHELVDMPFFVGRIDLDSAEVDGRWTRLASYPAGSLAGETRALLWDQIGKTVPVMAAVFQETPWDTYTNLLVFTADQGGGAALEHANSHLGIYNPGFRGNSLLASITAHETFHAWNVKRLRPAEMWPYDYHQPQPTVWLWVSEGITDYYADLALVRGGVIDSAQFLGVTAGKIAQVEEAPPTALEDASLSTWIGPVDGTKYLYYPKGSLAGLMLDILIREASDNRRSLDDLMREVYRTAYKQGRGFTTGDWWRTASRLAGGKSFTEFATKYVDGREPFPWDQVLPLAGLRMVHDTLREPRLGIGTQQDSAGAVVVRQVIPGGSADEAGIKVGDVLLAISDIEITSPDFGSAYRARFGKSEGDSLSIRVRRGGQTLTLTGRVRLGTRMESRLEADGGASEKAARIRSGLLRGTVDR